MLLLTQREAALALRLSERTLERWRIQGIAIWRLYGEAYYRDVYKFRQWMWDLVFEQAKEEVANQHPDWARQWPELFR